MQRKSNNPSSLVRIEKALSLNPFDASVSGISRRVRRVTERDRDQLLQLANKALRGGRTRKNKYLRTAAVKLLVACYPSSLPLLQEWLERHDSKDVFEIHFSIFCFLDAIPAQSSARSNSASPLSLVSDYLHRVRVETARAAWMAGDLLGDHWPLRYTLPVLSDLSGNARYVAGRCGAVHGLVEALARGTSEQKSRIRETLIKVTREDRSSEVRSLAEQALQGHCV